MYLTYQEYKNMEGELSESTFNILEFEARKKIDRLTFGRLKNLSEQKEEVKQCIFRIISIMEVHRSDITSESVDGYSITYKDNKGTEESIKGLIKDYLSDLKTESGVPYLYIGETRRDYVK